MEEGQGRRGKKSKSAPYKEGGASLPPQTSAKPPHLAAPITPFETKESVFSKRPAMRPFFQLLFQSNLRKQIRNLPKIQNFVKIIHYFSKLFTGVLNAERMVGLLSPA